jgi:hypothetical protein
MAASVVVLLLKNNVSAGPGGHSLAGTAVSNPASVIDVSVLYCVLSGRVLCDGLITYTEEAYRLYVCH